MKKKSCKSAIMDFGRSQGAVGGDFLGGVSWRYKEHLCQILASYWFFPAQSKSTVLYVAFVRKEKTLQVY